MERSGIQRFVYNIWPTIYRLINETFYFIIQVILKTIKLMYVMTFKRNG